MKATVAFYFNHKICTTSPYKSKLGYKNQMYCTQTEKKGKRHISTWNVSKDDTNMKEDMGLVIKSQFYKYINMFDPLIVNN